MADEDTALPADSTPAPAPQLPDDKPVDARAAARAMSDWRAKQAAPVEATPAARTEQPRDKGRFTSAAAPAESTSQEGDAAAAQQPPGDTTVADPADEQPSIEPPRSWTKEDKEAFRLLPPDRQQSIVDTERRRDAEIRRGQDDVANERKALQEKTRAAEEALESHRQGAQQALARVQSEILRDFPDIKSLEDERQLATNDPFRWNALQAAKNEFFSRQRDASELDAQYEQQKSRRFETFAKEQDDKFSKKFPDFNDPEKGSKLRASVTTYLTQAKGIPQDALQKLWTQSDIFRDALWQEVVYDASRFHAAQQAAKAAVQKPVPQVQRPGSAPQKGAQNQEAVASALDRLKNAKGNEAARAAADLMTARRRAAAH